MKQLRWLSFLLFASWLNAQQLKVIGDVPNPLTLTAEDLAQMPRETVTIPEQDGTKVAYEGVQLREILKRAGYASGKDVRGKALAAYIVAKAHDGYQVVFTPGEIDPDFGAESVLWLISATVSLCFNIRVRFGWCVLAIRRELVPYACWK